MSTITWRDFVEPPRKRMMSPINWYGGKGTLASWIISHLPRGKVYVEPYCGAASVFWRLPRPYPCEVLNDIDNRIACLFRVLQRRDSFERLAHRLVFTPYSREEFIRALAIQNSPDSTEEDIAWATFVLHTQGFSGTATCPGDWGRSTTSRLGMSMKSSIIRSRLSLLQRWHDRITRANLDNRDAITVIRNWDSSDTVFYVDPPYVSSARTKPSVYKHEATDEHHKQLIATMLSSAGMFVVSGYYSPLYAPLEHAGWITKSKNVLCAASNMRIWRPQQRTEVLWISPSAARAGTLFANDS